MSKLIFNFKENKIEIVSVSGWSKNIRIKKAMDFSPEIELSSDNASYNSTSNRNKLRKELKEHGIRNKNVHVILTLDGIITRLIDVPYMSKRDLNKFVFNNVGEYFTISQEDYYFDYRIISCTNLDKKKFSILLVAVPKSKITDIKDFLKSTGLTVKEISIYPDYIARIFSNRKDRSIAVIDISRQKGYITILDRGNIFLFSSINTDSLEEEGSYGEFVDNVGYFLNFYASRHFGTKIDYVYIVGEHGSIDTIKERIKEQYEVDVHKGIAYKKLKLTSSKGINADKYAEVIGANISNKAIYNKNIDFIENKNSAKDPQRIKRTVTFYLPAVLASVTLVWVSASFLLMQNMLNRYDTASIEKEIQNYADIKKTVDDINKSKELLQTKTGYLEEVKKDSFDYISLLNTIRQGIPAVVTIKSMTINKEVVDVVFNVNNSTLDAAELVIALNKMGIFEPVEISRLNLDDTVKEISYTLKLKKN